MLLYMNDFQHICAYVKLLYLIKLFMGRIASAKNLNDDGATQSTIVLCLRLSCQIKTALVYIPIYFYIPLVGE